MNIDPYTTNKNSIIKQVLRVTGCNELVKCISNNSNKMFECYDNLKSHIQTNNTSIYNQVNNFIENVRVSNECKQYIEDYVVKEDLYDLNLLFYYECLISSLKEGNKTSATNFYNKVSTYLGNNNSDLNTKISTRISNMI